MCIRRSETSEQKHDSDENLTMAACSTQLHSPRQRAATVHDECSKQPRDLNITHESAARGQSSVVRNACQGRDSQYCKSGCRQARWIARIDVLAKVRNEIRAVQPQFDCIRS